MVSSRFLPTLVSYLPDKRPTVVYVASFAAAVYSLLSDLAPVIDYMDGLVTVAFGRLGLTPFIFTLGIFNAATRSRKEAWITIYYHPDDAAEASLHKSPTTSFHKCQNLHRGLEAAFSEYCEITRKGRLRCWDSVRYSGPIHNVIFKFSLAFVIGDTEMHDKMCGKTLNRTATAQCLYRHCDAPLEQSINNQAPSEGQRALHGQK